MNYADANVFLFAILNDKNEPMAKASTSILDKVVESEVRIATSFLTWDEVVWNVRKRLGSDLADSEGRKFLRFPGLDFIAVDEAIIALAQSLMEKYKLKPRDAIHAASALSRGIKQIVSNDPDFDAVKELKRIPIEEFGKD
ncbi:MAG: type II toxin-antitoxin system VapC family toxin [Candidatus Aenigmarchaeota archaeon]|nr:type II toxin-antitoxin system VapC family toxin [Candidatus Aenigmarchaeota archaeon]